MTGFAARRLSLSDMDEAARIHRLSFDERLPWLAGLHTPDEDRAFFHEHVFHRCECWGADENHALIGFIAFREGWIDQLYVLPAHQGCGAGGALLAKAQEMYSSLQLWTFQKNGGARRFYERRDFIAVRETDGADNEEREPDILYRWTRNR